MSSNIYAGQISALIISSLHTFASVSNMSSSSEIFEVLGLVVRVKKSCLLWGDPGGPVVNLLATGPEVRGFKPGRGRWIFSEAKILSMTSFEREVKPWVPSRRYMARKRTSSRNQSL